MKNTHDLTTFIDNYFKAVKGFTAALQAAVAPYDLSFEQYQIMRDIADQRIATLTDIVRLRGVTKPAIARQISSLLRLGYVTQTTAGNDHRRRILHLTKTGSNVEQIITSVAQERFQQLQSQMGAANIVDLSRLLAKLNAALAPDTDHSQD